MRRTETAIIHQIVIKYFLTEFLEIRSYPYLRDGSPGNLYLSVVQLQPWGSQGDRGKYTPIECHHPSFQFPGFLRNMESHDREEEHVVIRGLEYRGLGGEIQYRAYLHLRWRFYPVRVHEGTVSFTQKIDLGEIAAAPTPIIASTTWVSDPYEHWTDGSII